jgi:hypothetical protein
VAAPTSPVRVEVVDWVSVEVGERGPPAVSVVRTKLVRLLSVATRVDDTLNDDGPSVGCGIPCVPVMAPGSACEKT